MSHWNEIESETTPFNQNPFPQDQALRYAIQKFLSFSDITTRVAHAMLLHDDAAARLIEFLADGGWIWTVHSGSSLCSTRIVIAPRGRRLVRDLTSDHLELLVALIRGADSQRPDQRRISLDRLNQALQPLKVSAGWLRSVAWRRL